MTCRRVEFLPNLKSSLALFALVFGVRELGEESTTEKMARLKSPAAAGLGE